MEFLAKTIEAIVEGDLSGMVIVRAAPHDELLGAVAKRQPLIVSRVALVRVLESWRSGLFSAEEVQQWASFVRRGYVSGCELGEVNPILIDYDLKDEELILEIIGRFDEIGDRVDGKIDAYEQEEILRLLKL